MRKDCNCSLYQQFLYFIPINKVVLDKKKQSKPIWVFTKRSTNTNSLLGHSQRCKSILFDTEIS